MKKFFVMMIAAFVLAVSTANTAEASLITKRIEGVKKIANLVSSWTWKNKGSIAVGTVATVALTNPEATKAAVTGGADIVKNAVTGTADGAYGTVTGGRTADTVAPRANARPSTMGGSIFPTLPTLLFYLFVTVLVIAAVRYCLHSVGLRRVLPLLIVGVLLCSGGIVEAAVITPPPPVFPPVPWLTLLNIAAIVISIFI
jgi:hypothetical protein